MTGQPVSGTDGPSQPPSAASFAGSLATRILASAPEGMVALDRDLRVLYWNHGMEELTGHPAPAIVGRFCREACPALKELGVDVLMARALAGERVRALELDTVALGWPGPGGWVSFEFGPLRDERDAVVGVLGLVRNITGQRRAEATLRLQSVALEAAANAIAITDREGGLVWVNPAFSRLTGYSLAEVAGQNPRVLKSGAHPREFYERMWGTITAGRVWHGEVVNRRKDDSLYTEEMTITPVQDARGAISHFIAIKQDVTARKAMEAELLQSRQRFERIFQSNPAAMCILTRGEGRVLDVNDSFLRLFGFTREAALGATFADLNLWVDPAQPALLMEGAGDAAGAPGHEVRLRARNGEVLDTLVSTESIQLGAEPCRLFILVDITERKRLEEQLRHSQKMEGIGTLAGGVAHDFNNLLTILQGHASLAMTTEGLPARTVESLRHIVQAAEQAANLTRQLLTFSRKQPVQRRLLDLNEVVGNLTRMLRRIIGEDVTLDFEYAPRLPLLLADAGMMEQVLLNLAVNARDAMPEGGRLAITTEAVTLDAVQAQRQPGARPGQFVCLTVQDSGGGIPPEVLPRIFEPFFTTKDVGKGTGLGLATVHGIVQQHQGWIEVASTVGVGTTFRLYFPASPHARPPAEAPAAEKPVQGGHETILLVEDEPPVQRLACEVLARQGYRVLRASSGVAALEVWKAHGAVIDLLLTDVVMPGGLSGRRLADQLRAERPSLRVVFTSGYSPDVAGRDLERRNGVRFLAKPYPPLTLARLVRECLDEPPAA